MRPPSMNHDSSEYEDASSSAVCRLARVVPKRRESCRRTNARRRMAHLRRRFGHTRYAPLDQIDASNFSSLEVAWRYSVANLGPTPETRFQSTPLVVDGVLYTTGGSRRAVTALDAATGEQLWVYSLNEGERGAEAPRRLSGRGLAFWQTRRRQARDLRDARLSAHRVERGRRQAHRELRRRRHRRSARHARPRRRLGRDADRHAFAADDLRAA